jgi:antitoxin MazE
MLVSKVQKWGNGQGLRLPKHVLELAEIAVGDQVELVVGEGEIVVRKARRPKYDLADLVSRIPEGSRPEEVDLGPPVGREAW